MQIHNNIKAEHRDIPLVRAALALLEASTPHVDGVAYYSLVLPLFAGGLHGYRPHIRPQWVVFDRHIRVPLPPNEMARNFEEITLVDRCVYESGPVCGALIGRAFTSYRLYKAIEPGTTDICGYCGADNGAGGSARQGYDCQQCGGN